MSDPQKQQEKSRLRCIVESRLLIRPPVDEDPRLLSIHYTRTMCRQRWIFKHDLFSRYVHILYLHCVNMLSYM